MTNTNKSADADFGPGDIVTVSRRTANYSGPLYTVVGLAGQDVLLCRGIVKCAGQWRPELEDVAVYVGNVSRLR
jgi:hypothetical protein